MGGFWSSIYLKLFPPEHFKVFMSGLDCAGKTTVLYRYKLNETVNSIPTVGFNVESVKINDHVTIQAWDVGGGWAIRKLFYHYYDDCKALVYIIDCSDVDRFDDAAKEFWQMAHHEKMKKTVVMVLANKQDLFQDGKPFVTNELITEKMRLNELAEQKRTCRLFKCTAMKGQGLDEAITWLGQQLYLKRKNKEF